MNKLMRKNGALVAAGAAMLLLGACGDTDGSGDGGVIIGDSAASTADGPKLYVLSSGSFKVLSASMVTDGCMIGVDKTLAEGGVIGASFPLTLDNTTGDVSLGNLQGNPLVPSLGKGKIGANMGTLMMETDITAEAPSMCKLHRKVTSILTLTADQKFTLAVTRTDSMRMMCSVPAGVGESCTSTYTWTFDRDTTPDGGS